MRSLICRGRFQTCPPYTPVQSYLWTLYFRSRILVAVTNRRVIEYQTPPRDIAKEKGVAKFKVVIRTKAGADPANEEFDFEKEALGLIDAEIVGVSATTDDEFIEVARDADAIIAEDKITTKMVESLQKCKVIALGSVGTDTIDVVAATERGIPVSNCPDTFVDEVADHTMTLILAAWRRLTLMDTMVKDGRWGKARPYLYQFPRLRGQTLGFISFGHIATATAARAAPFGFRLLAHDPYIDEQTISEHGAEPVGLTELLQRSDIVSMHAPGMEETVHMLTEEHFRMMKPNALFINNGRGSTVDEPALIKALEEGWIAGAGLDVFEQEPPDPKNPLLHMENVIVTAHVASASSRFDPQRRRRVGQEVSLVLTGRWPRACVNPSVLEKSGLQRWQPYSMERGRAR